MPTTRLNLPVRLILVFSFVGLNTGFLRAFGLTNPTTVALSYLLIVLAVAAGWGLAESLICSVAATLCFNYFFLPPIGTWAIEDVENWVALAAFLVVAVVASELSERARQKTRQLIRHEEEKAQVAELARTAEMLRQSETFKSTLLDGLAHELKTPLTSLKAAVSALRAHGNPGAGAGGELLVIIEEEADHLNRLISEVLQMARIEAGDLRLHLTACRIESLIVGARENVERQLYQHIVSVDVEQGLPEVWADPDLIRKVLQNLLENAAKYSLPGTRIEIRASESGGLVHICVADEGLGLREEEIAQVFDRYYRAPATRTISGMGMGLAIARDIVTTHGGLIWVESSPGAGSAFTFTLPRADQRRS